MSISDKETLLVDGAQGEGGGQIIRSSLSLAAISGRPVKIKQIRVGRARPGLAAQHLTSVRAVAALCNAELVGDVLGSLEIAFRPRRRIRGGRYSFNVADARRGGSAGASALVLQSVLLPLALAGGGGLTLLGGTHVPHSPSFDFLERVFLPTLATLGLEVTLELKRPGFYPVGGGRMLATVGGLSQLSPLKLNRPGQLRSVSGRVLTAGQKPEIAARIEAELRRLLEPLAVPLELEQLEMKAHSPGVAVLLEPRYEHGRAGFTAIDKRGRPAEQIAVEAADALLAHHRSGAAVDVRLADQLLLPLCFAKGDSSFTTDRASGHLLTNASVIEQFGLARVSVSDGDGPVRVDVCPISALR